jgi:predicted nucleic acid-binding protein
MSGWLLDTLTVSELRKLDRAQARVIAWGKTAPGPRTWISVITLNEIRIGIRQVEPRDPGFAEKLDAWYHGLLLPNFQNRILSVDVPIAEAAAEMRVSHGLSFNDALIAATASVHHLTLATRNVSDFAHTGISIVNPWGET